MRNKNSQYLPGDKKLSMVLILMINESSWFQSKARDKSNDSCLQPPSLRTEKRKRWFTRAYNKVISSFIPLERGFLSFMEIVLY